MARTLTPVDACAIVSLVEKQITGQAQASVVDTSNFVSVGEKILASGVENTLNALALVVGETYVAVRPYDAKLKLINALDSGVYSNRKRKISFYARDPKQAGSLNTNLNTNLAMGYDNGTNSGNSVGNMWEQNAPVPLELNFDGTSTWDDSTTVYLDQLQVAFRSPEEFAKFANGAFTEKANDIESEKEAFNRLNLLNFMAGLYDLDIANPNGRAVNLVAAFNTYYGTSYTTADLLGAHKTEFFEYLVARIRIDSTNMTSRSARYHYSPAKTVNGVSYTLLRHTPNDKQKLMMYEPFMAMAKTTVMPAIFNDEYLKMENYEGVDFWQANTGDIKTAAAINVTPAIPDVANNGNSQIAGTPVSLDYVVGLLFDEEALMTDYQLDGALSTPVEARKRYSNIWWTFRKNNINDFTENAILYYMADPTS